MPGESLEGAARRETQETGPKPLGLARSAVVSGPGAFVPEGERCSGCVTAMFRASRFSGELGVGNGSYGCKAVSVRRDHFDGSDHRPCTPVKQRRSFADSA